MKKMYVEDGFKFTEISKEMINELRKVPAERVVVSIESARKIESILKMDEYSNDELCGLRNSIVKDFPDEDYDDWTRVSMITCIIDQEKHKRGMEI